MKLSESFFYTLREDVKDEESVSGNLLVKSGMFKKVGNGIYMKMPLGQKVVDNVKAIVRKNMNEAGALEVTMPMLLPIEVFQKSKRYELFGPSIFQLNDRYNRPYVLGPTHEEFFVLAAMMKAKSYKDFPYTLYQIGNKYRDEVRPRLGLIRTREFTMKDAYSFDINQEECDKSYKKQFDAYNKICKEVGLNYAVVRADTGVMGGLLSEEFQAVTDVGEDILVLCDKCDYASNIEVSKCVDEEIDNNEEKMSKEKVYTPNSGTIEDVSKLLNMDASKFVKTLIYKIDGKFYACLVQGDKEVIDILKRMNVEFTASDKGVKAILKEKLVNTIIDGSQCPDIIPVLTAVASLSEGTTEIINAGRLRIKECDRLAAVTMELNKLGAKIIEEEDGLVVTGVSELQGGVEVWSHNDHRIAMTLAIASTKCNEPIIIKDYKCIVKSYPNFFEDFKTLGGNIHEWNVGK